MCKLTLSKISMVKKGRLKSMAVYRHILQPNIFNHDGHSVFPKVSNTRFFSIKAAKISCNA